MEHQNFCLKWESFQSNVTSVFEDLRQEDELVDITLCCEGERFPAHRMMLSACSPYFRDVLKKNTCQHMMFYMKDTAASDLRALVEFIYKGCVNVSQNQLPSFIKLAESLQIRGLSGDEEKKPSRPRKPPTSTAPQSPPTLPHPPVVRARSPCASVAGQSAKRVRRSSVGSDSGGAASRDSVPVPSPRSGPTSPHPAVPGPSHSLDSPDQPALKSENVKLEKVDLTEDDDCEEEGSLEATLGQVAEYEGFDGSSQGMFSADFHQHMLSTEYGGDDISSMAMSSQSMTVDEGNSKGFLPSVFHCRPCRKHFSNRARWMEHVKFHQGKTRCHLCGAVYSTVNNLRKHLRNQHEFTRSQMCSLDSPHSS